MPEINYLNYQISYLNLEEVNDLKREIFTHQIYYFETDSSTPIIIDAGAHIGLATLYFKHLYPHARLLAFEPNPTNFALLSKNIAQNHLENVTLIPKALGKHENNATFYVDRTPFQWLSTSSLIENAWDGSQKTTSLTVQTTRLDQYLLDFPQINLLKLDIEGAESTVIFSLHQQLDKVQHLIFEFHPTKSQNLTELLSFLTKKGFTCTLKNRQNKILKSYHHHELIIVDAFRA